VDAPPVAVKIYVLCCVDVAPLRKLNVPAVLFRVKALPTETLTFKVSVRLTGLTFGFEGVNVMLPVYEPVIKFVPRPARQLELTPTLTVFTLVFAVCVPLGNVMQLIKPAGQVPPPGADVFVKETV
jgi:hypothetical protein